MKNTMRTIRTIVTSALIIALSLVTFNIKSFAYSAIPDCFDFGDSMVTMDAGTTRDVWVRATYNYDSYIGPHTSNQTYIECSQKSGSQHVILHIGPDEQQPNVCFYFHVNDDRMPNTDLTDCIEAYVQNINPEYARVQDMGAPLKWYAGNNAQFNAYDYYMNYPDLRNAYGANGDALYHHFCTNGQAEGRIANRLIV